MELIISNISSIFLVAGIGLLANKTGVLPMSANKYLSALLIKVTCPCMVITSISSNTLTDDTFAMSIQAIVCSALWFYFSGAIGFFLSKKVLRTSSDDQSTYTIAFGSANNGFIGFPITLAIFGSSILYMMVLHNIAMAVFFMYSLAPLIVNMGSSDGKVNVKGVLTALANPNILAAFIGFFLLFTGIRLPSPVFDCLDLVGSSTTALSMLLVGLQLGECHLMTIIKNKSLLIMSLLKMTVIPALTFVVFHWLPVAVEVKVCMVFAASFPAAVAIVPVISEENKDASLAAEIVALTTLISMAVIPAAATILISVYGISA